jgi:hypothetical protein
MFQTAHKILFKTEQHVFLIHLYIMGYQTVQTVLDGFQKPFKYQQLKNKSTATAQLASVHTQMT